jgi:transcriptional regulator with XRE-family HTH domain
MFQITLKAARVNAGLTQAEVAKAIGKAPGTLCSWEREKGIIDVNSFYKMCKLYHVDPERILLHS